MAAAMDLDGILEEFAKRRNDASRRGSTSSGPRYARHVRQWAEYLADETGVTLWEANYVHLRMYMRALDRGEWPPELESGYAPGSIRQRVSAVSKFYQDLAKMAEEPEYDLPAEPPEENPFDGLDDEDKEPMKGETVKSRESSNIEGIHYPEPQEVDALLENRPAPTDRNELIIRLLFCCGFRREELATVKVQHVDRDDNTIFIPAKKSTYDRRVTFDPDYVGIRLDEWMDWKREAVPTAAESPFLFPTERHEHISPDYINQMVKEAAEAAGIQEVVGKYADGREMHRITAHSLRHGYAVQAIKSGINVRSLMELMGHEKLETTLRYLKLAESDVIRESRSFDPYAQAD